MYKYESMKSVLFTDAGQRKFIKTIDFVKEVIQKAGCVRMDVVLSRIGGDAWEVMACVDRLVELGELKEVLQCGAFGQDRIFIST